MQGIRAAVYESWGDLRGKESTHQELILELRRYSRDSVLWVCSYISVTLKLFLADSPDAASYVRLIDWFFAPKLATRFKVGFWVMNPQRLVFHRRQLLYLAKLAILHCDASGLDAGRNGNGFAKALLMANDHLHHGLLSGIPLDLDNREDVLKVTAELLSTQEYSGHIRAGAMLRAYKMFLEIPRQLIEHTDYIDMDWSFTEGTGLRYIELFAINIASISRYFKLDQDAIDANRLLLLSHQSQCSQLKIRAEKVSRFYGLLSKGPDEIKRDMQENPGVDLDLTFSKRTPLVHRWMNVGTHQMSLGHLPLDVELWMQKLYSEAFWFLFGKHRSKFLRFWGAVFEVYVHSLLHSMHVTHNAVFVKNPRDPNNSNNELCDALVIEGDTLIIIEYKSVLFRADIKYGGDVGGLSDLLEKRFVRESSGQPKAVLQLAKAVNCLFSGARPSVPGMDLSQIKKCFPVCITLDSIGAAVGLSTYLNSYFLEAISQAPMNGIQIMPLACFDVTTLEILLHGLSGSTLRTVLERWHRENPSLFTPLSAISMPDLRSAANDAAYDEWSSVMDTAIHELFDEQTIQASRADRLPASLHPLRGVKKQLATPDALF